VKDVADFNRAALLNERNQPNALTQQHNSEETERETNCELLGEVRLGSKATLAP
jgi:hypothetical protein